MTVPATHSQPDSRNSDRFTPVVRKIELAAPFEYLQRLSRLERPILLESAAKGRTPSGNTGRFSYLMADPFEKLTVDAGDLNPFSSWRASAKRFNSPTLPGLPPFQGGYAGLLSYELNRSFESISAAKYDEFPLPAMAMAAYDVVIAWDHETDACWLISQGFPETDPDCRIARANRRADFFESLLTRPNHDFDRLEIPSPEIIANEDLACERFRVPGPDGILSNFSRESYLRAVQQAVEYIYAGDVFQINLAQQLLYPATQSPLNLYEKVRSNNPAPFACYVDLGGAQIVSSSPERLVSVNDRRVETRPIKGTRRRTRYPEVDVSAMNELQRSVKDRAENVMIVDLMRNDLSRVCVDDSIEVTQLCGLESYESVFHLVSAIEGRLRHDCDAFDLLSAVMPGGSITGAPKVRAMEIIAELEPTARNAYCGSVGFVGFNGNVDFNILIRTMTQQSGWLQIPVGGGIVAQSNPEQEYEETWTKAAGLLSAL